MSFDVETLKTQIPHYLTSAAAQKEFVEQLDALNEGATVGYFLNGLRDPYAREMLQGDGWSGFEVLAFASGKRASVRGIVLSNSCDISPDNERAAPTQIVFAPIIKLTAVQAQFEKSGLSAERVNAKIAAIKKQKVTSVFYLPKGEALTEECVVFLDNLHSMPAVSCKKKAKLFTLSQAGFYLFLFKLSVHFCRFQENIDRRTTNVMV